MNNSYIAPAIFATLIVILIGGFFAFNNYIYQQKQSEAPVTLQYQASLTGEQVCLPHKNSSGPQTKECAIGLKTTTGEYYALNLDQVTSEYMNLPSGTIFTASGIVTPVENLNSNQLQKYDIKGILAVTEIVIVNQIEKPDQTPNPTPTTPPDPVSTACYVGGCSSQICSDSPDVVSTCEYREEYACYQNATCERQTTGQCGWTETTELSSCLANS